MLDIDWLPADWPTAWDEKYGERSMPIGHLLQLSDRKHVPAIVYIHDSLEAEAEAELEADMFGNEDLILGTRFFRCYRINASSIQDEKIKAEFARKLPTLVFLDGRGDEVMRLQGKNRASRVQSAMKKVFGDHFKVSMPKVLRQMSDLLDDVERAEDKMADARRLLDDVEERMADRDGDTAEKKIEKRREAYEVAKAEFEKLLAKVVELANQPLKNADVTSKP
ncbi:MAG: hypothetical protein H6807_16245 [Planctomycetes bacterium]|nr:hypothetical protein [Planctomycetota bacterium]